MIAYVSKYALPGRSLYCFLTSTVTLKLAAILFRIKPYNTSVLSSRRAISCVPFSQLARMSEGEPKKRYQPTPEQLALAEERRLTKAAHKAAQKEKEKHEVEERSRIFSRDWLSIDLPVPGNVAVKVMTWNVSYLCVCIRMYTLVN